MSSKGKGISVVTTGAICIIAYLIGILVSPHLVAIDFVSSKLEQKVVAQQSNEQPNGIVETKTTSSPTPATPPTALPKNKKKTEAAKEGESSSPTQQQDSSPQATPIEPAYKSIINFESQNDPFHGVDIIVHRNGEPDPCDRQEKADDDDDDNDAAASPDSLSSTSKTLLHSLGKLHGGSKAIDTHDKYDFDAVLTHSLVVGKNNKPILQNQGSTCGPTWKDDGKHYMDMAPHLKDKTYSDMIKYCDMGFHRTPIQLDHKQYVKVPEIISMPCHFHTREGLRVTSLEQLAQLAREAKAPITVGECTEEERNADGTCGEDGNTAAISNYVGRKELNLYAVQAGRVFIFAPKYVGEIFELPHVKIPQDLPVWLEVISLQPRVFDVFNFFDRAESAAIVDKAMKETSETHRIKRSSTGASGYNVNSQRTSENGFDTHGNEAQAVKRRCMNVLGFETYEESLTDGLQVLRYNKTTAYVPHLDWIDDYGKKQEHDFDTEHLGSNRFATILLYMSDLEGGDGGETVFAHGWPPNQPVEERVEFNDALQALRDSNDVEGLLKPGSWEEKMVARCRSRLAVRPHSSRAVLFYSQNPDGTPDQNSMHGGCPVISGEKWAANLWVWNAPRGGFPGSPVNQAVVDRNRKTGKTPADDMQKKASFSNTNTDDSMRNAELFFQETFWGKLGFGSPALNVNTYEGHQWNVKVDGKTLKTFAIDKRATQLYTV